MNITDLNMVVTRPIGGLMSSKEDFYSNLPSFTTGLFETKPLYKETPKKPVVKKHKPIAQPQQRQHKKIADLAPKSPMMKKIMRAKELDTKIRVMREQGKSPRDFVDLLDEFQKNSMDLEQDL